MVQFVGASSRKPKDYGFSPQSRHVQKATNQCFSLTSMFLCFSLPSPLSKSMSMSWSEDKYVFFNIFSACRYREHTTFHGSLSLAWTCCWKAPPILQLLRPPVALALPEAFKNSASALRHTSVQKLGLPLAAIQPHAYYSSLSESKLFICTMGAVRYPTS